MKTKSIACLIAAIATVVSTGTVRAAMPAAGTAAPLFAAQDQNGHSFKLSNLIGKRVVLLYFYPKDFTGGCTKEACGYRDRMPELEKDGVQVVGVSFDSAASHRAFEKKYHLNFILIPDPDGRVADLYGARMNGRNMDKRVSFLIGLDGRIMHVTDSPNPAVHFREMKEAIAALKK
ncbi:MAG: peroxiredoxin [Verrucomicrobia bacterium]|nr:peroxiredoxin [Verrucomicrobiota bacterium]MDE3099991.1 peroxiredoxin [Verrucomicrobiota bacterium]